jgi:hypothetical protein
MSEETIMIDPDVLDQLIQVSTAEAELRNGKPPAWVVARHGVAAIVAQGHLEQLGVKLRKSAAPRWTSEEDRFLEENLGWLSEEEIADALGRSVNAVHLRWDRDRGLPAPSKHPEWMTGNTVARILDVDIHSVMKLVDRGILPGRRTPGERNIRLINRKLFRRWAINPMNWVYFIRSIEDPTRIQDRRLRRLIDLQRERWSDCWWTPGQVAAYYGSTDRDVNRYLRKGKFKGCIKWGNWWILRSEALQAGLVFFRGKGAAQGFDEWSDEGDAFMILARAIGLPWHAVALLMGNHKVGKISHRVYLLHQEGQLAKLIDKYGLEIKYDSETVTLRADWREYHDRFPFVVSTVKQFLEGRKLSYDRLVALRRVLGAWGLYHAETDEQRRVALRLIKANVATQRSVYRTYEKMKQLWEIDPLELPGYVIHRKDLSAMTKRPKPIPKPSPVQRSALQKMAEHGAVVKFNQARIPSWVDGPTRESLDWRWGPELRIPTLRALVANSWCQLAQPEQDLDAADQVISIIPAGKAAIDQQEKSA